MKGEVAAAAAAHSPAVLQFFRTCYFASIHSSPPASNCHQDIIKVHSGPAQAYSARIESIPRIPFSFTKSQGNERKASRLKAGEGKVTQNNVSSTEHTLQCRQMNCHYCHTTTGRKI